MNDQTTLRPGILVSCKSKISGGVKYTRTDPKVETDGREECSAWETTKTVSDIIEHKAAETARGAAINSIRAICIKTPFGLICPEDREQELVEAIDRGRRLVDEFNARAQYSMVEVYVLRGRISATDGEAIRAIGGELRDLMAELRRGLADLNVERVRDVANRAKALGQMLDRQQQERVDDAVSAARKAARVLVKEIAERGEATLDTLKSVDLAPIDASRFAFLDVDGPAEATDKVELPEYQPAQPMLEL